jgi:hypothetical protein
MDRKATATLIAYEFISSECPFLKISRAEFLKACGIALLSPGVSSAAFLDVRLVRLQDVTAALFRPHLGSEFAIRTPLGTRSRFVLAEVTERPLIRNVAQFSLIFHGSAETGTGDGNYVLHHATLGSFELFIVPIGLPDRRRKVYQACFSRHLNHPSGRA